MTSVPLRSAGASPASAAEGEVARCRPLRVVHCMTSNNGMTGVETFVLQLCAAQMREGLSPSIALELAGRAGFGRRDEVARAGAALGIGVVPLPERSAWENRLPKKLGTASLRARRLWAVAELARAADVLHIHAVGIAGLEELAAGALIRTRAIVVTHHTTLGYSASMRDRVSDLTFFLEKRAASLSVMPYAAASQELGAAGVAASRRAVIPFCIDEGRFTGLATPPAPGELKLLMASRMVEGKGHEVLLAAVAKLRPRHPGLRLLVVGEGPTRPRIEAEIDRLELRGAVDMAGHVDHGQMPALLRSAHVVVLPSFMQGETFPLCLLEGMAMGLPAIGTRWFGIPDIIEDGQTGFVVEPREPEALARAIERFLVEPALWAAASRRAQERVRARFTGAAVARAYSKAYEAALDR